MTFDPDELAHGPRLKLKRAIQHIEELNVAISDFIARDACRLVLKRDPKTRRSEVVFEQDSPPSDLIGPIVGDAAHNIRTALDLLAVAIATAAGAKAVDGIYFPFHKRPEGFEGAIAGTQIHRCGPDVCDILSKLKLYEGSKSPLRQLHDLDIRDKHLVIVTASTITAFDAAAQILPIDPDFPAGIGLNFFRMEDGGKLISWPYNPPNRRSRRAAGDMQNDHKLEATFEIVFGDIPGFKSEPIIPTLESLRNLADGIVTSVAVATATYLNSQI